MDVKLADASMQATPLALAPLLHGYREPAIMIAGI